MPSDDASAGVESLFVGVVRNALRCPKQRRRGRDGGAPPALRKSDGPQFFGGDDNRVVVDSARGAATAGRRVGKAVAAVAAFAVFGGAARPPPRGGSPGGGGAPAAVYGSRPGTDAVGSAAEKAPAAYAEVSALPLSPEDVPLFWHVPRSGGTAVRDVLGRCLGLVVTGGAAELGGEGQQSLRVITNSDGVRYVNVDTTTPEGILRARSLDLVGSGLADVVVVSDFRDVERLFGDDVSPGRRAARVFALLRHPVKRAVSEYFQLREEAVAGMTLLRFAESDLGGEDNPLVRSLAAAGGVDDRIEMVSTRLVEEAKEVLRRHVLVGIAEFMDESVLRFERYFGWRDGIGDNPDTLQCRDGAIRGGDTRGAHETFKPGTPEFRALSLLHWADVEVYQFAKVLFREQASLVS